MKNRILKTAVATACVLAATLSIGTPAHAGGSLSVNVRPADGRQAEMMRTGLQLYSLFNDARGGALVSQRGTRNRAGIAQRGAGNVGVVHQEGEGHNGTLRQTGGGNSYGLFQFGRNTNGHVVQNGDGGAGLTFQWGW